MQLTQRRASCCRFSENALWDIVGKVCKQPLHKLWGSFRSEMPLYLTTVWPVPAPLNKSLYCPPLIWQSRIRYRSFFAARSRSITTKTRLPPRSRLRTYSS